MDNDALRSGLKAVKLGNMKTKEEMKMEFSEGILEMRCAYGLSTDGMFDDREIYKTLMGGS